MDLVKGVKVSEAFPGDQKSRAIVARRLSNALTYDVIFNRRDPRLRNGNTGWTQSNLKKETLPQRSCGRSGAGLLDRSHRGKGN